jgi:hypothetical protein
MIVQHPEDHVEVLHSVARVLYLQPAHLKQVHVLADVASLVDSVPALRSVRNPDRVRPSKC